MNTRAIQSTANGCTARLIYSDEKIYCMVACALEATRIHTCSGKGRFDETQKLQSYTEISLRDMPAVYHSELNARILNA